MKHIVILLSLLGVIFAQEDIKSGKDYYEPRPYFYSTSGLLDKGSPIYDMKEITNNGSIKNKIAECIILFEIIKEVPRNCSKAFNSIKYYVTTPDDALIRDVIEYALDIPMEEYFKELKNLTKEQREFIKQNYYRKKPPIYQQAEEDITQNVLNQMREEQRHLRR